MYILHFKGHDIRYHCSKVGLIPPWRLSRVPNASSSGGAATFESMIFFRFRNGGMSMGSFPGDGIYTFFQGFFLSYQLVSQLVSVLQD